MPTLLAICSSCGCFVVLSVFLFDIGLIVSVLVLITFLYIAMSAHLDTYIHYPDSGIVNIACACMSNIRVDYIDMIAYSVTTSLPYLKRKVSKLIESVNTR